MPHLTLKIDPYLENTRKASHKKLAIFVLCVTVRDFLGRRFVFAMQTVYWSHDYDPDAPRNPEVYLATLSNEPVQVNISAPIHTNTPFFVSTTT